MSTLTRPETASRTQLMRLAPDFADLARLIVLAMLMVLTPPLAARPGGALQAIERVEHCSQQERKQGCVRILKRKAGKNGRRAIKAQIRGGRIIWYEYNPATGAVRRTN